LFKDDANGVVLSPGCVVVPDEVPERSDMVRVAPGE
jgi:hypothetical protein